VVAKIVGSQPQPKWFAAKKDANKMKVIGFEEISLFAVIPTGLYNKLLSKCYALEASNCGCS
jgi:hypothetical protein